MDGVMILSEMSVRGEELGFVIAWVILTIGYIVVAIWDNVEQWHYSGWGTRIMSIIVTLMIGALTSIIAIGLCHEYNTFHTEYKVIIDDSVGFNEFTERYKIISNDGDVYTVVEKHVD